MMNVDNVMAAIRLAHLDAIETVEVSVEDLVELVRFIEEQKGQLQKISHKIINKDIQISGLIADSLMKPYIPKLDTYI